MTGRSLLKHVASMASGILIGAAATLVAISWQEEKLRFELSPPAVFGDIVFQNLRLTNDGWNPATNVKVYVTHPDIAARNVQSSPSFNLRTDDAGMLGGYDRVRRGEIATLTFSFKGAPIAASMIAIKSDRSIARPQVGDRGALSLVSFLLGACLGVLLLLVPVYRALRRWLERPRALVAGKDPAR